MKMRVTGFTLIELMITVAIVAILTAIALPSYQAYVLRSHRTVGINALMDLASREARYYTTNNAYQTNTQNLGYSGNPIQVPDAVNPYYKVDAAAACVAPASVCMQAVPVGNQVNDTCGTFTYNDLGVKGVSAGSVQDCWKN